VRNRKENMKLRGGPRQGRGWWWWKRGPRYGGKW